MKKKNYNLRIAIDSPAAAGAGTVAKSISKLTQIQEKLCSGGRIFAKIYPSKPLTSETTQLEPPGSYVGVRFEGKVSVSRRGGPRFVPVHALFIAD